MMVEMFGIPSIINMEIVDVNFHLLHHLELQLVKILQ